MALRRPEIKCAQRHHTLVVIQALILVVLTAAAAYWLSRSGDISDALVVAHRLAWPILLLAVIAQLFSYVSSGELLRATVRQSGHSVRISRATIIQTASSSLSLIPGGNVGCAAAVYRWTRGGGVPSYSAAAAGLVVTVFNALSLLFFAIVSALLLVAHHELSRKEAIGVAIVSVGIVVTIIIVLSAAIRPGWAKYIVSLAHRLPAIGNATWLQRADERIGQLGATVSRLRYGSWGVPTLSAALNVAFDAATLGLVFYAAGAQVGAATLLAGYGLPVLLGQASFLPGGLAVTELSMSAIYIKLGLSPSVVIASVVMYRLISLWLPALIGLPLIAYLQLKDRSHTSRIRSFAPTRELPIAKQQVAGGTAFCKASRSKRRI